MAISEFESPLPHKKQSTKPATVAGFVFYQNNFAKTLPSILRYRPARIVKSKGGWYIEYYYLVPTELRPIYDNIEWYRFRQRQDMNRRKGKEKQDYADLLCDQINTALKQGYNPFEAAKDLIEQNHADIIEVKELGARDALWLFIDKWRERGLEKQSIAKYERYVGRLVEWLISKDLHNGPVTAITQTHIETFLQTNKRKYNLSNREYNNTYDFIRTAFNFLLKKKHITESPCAGVDKLKSNSTKHRFFDTASLTNITKALQLKDSYTYLAFQTVYYLCVRSDKELMNLKVGNIMWDQDKILADVGKGKTERYMPMDKNIKALFLAAGIDKYPGHFYIFGINGRPSEKPFGSGFFAKRFRKVRDAAGLDPDFTLYGAKHTRIVHLKSDGVSDADIMSLTGHKDFVSYAKYLRDLGMTADIKNLNIKSRKL
jgi:site-specific recombinase XerD